MFSAKARSSKTCRANRKKQPAIVVAILVAMLMVCEGAQSLGDMVKSFFAPVAAPVAISAPVEMPVSTVANITPLAAPAANTQSALKAVTALQTLPAAPARNCVTSKPGDTLSKLSAVLGKPWQQLAQINGMANANSLPVNKQICADGTAAPAHTNAVAAAYHPAGSPSRVSAMNVALQQIGKPYRWGATGPSSFDCSGLTSYAFKKAGITIPRTSRAQSTVGTPVSKANLQPGDLVFFYSPVSHVGIYIGNGQVVHASTSGQPVKISSVSAMPFNSARRV